MIQHPHQLIHLGKGQKTMQRLHRLPSPNGYVQDSIKMSQVNRDILASSHKLQAKQSPSKSKNYPHLANRKISVLNLQNSFTEMNHSIISVANQRSQISQPLNDKSNRIMSPNNQERCFVRVNFVNSNDNGSRTSSSHVREFKPSPTKLEKVAVSGFAPSYPGTNRQLESKVKILQNRIGELHKQKMQIVGKMNEQNRKLYHENTGLKLTINELQKKLNLIHISSQKQIKSKRDQNIPSSKSSIEGDNLKIQQLKTQIMDLQSLLKIEQQKTIQLNKKIEQFEQNQKEYEDNMALLTKQTENYKSLLAEQQEQVDNYRKNIQRFQKLLDQKSNQRQQYQAQLSDLKQTLTKTLQKNQEVFTEYQQKIQQYQLAYDHNQEIIRQLTNQLQIYVEKSPSNTHNNQDQINEKVQKPYEEHQTVEIDYQQFQNNLNNAMTERDNCLKQKNEQIIQLKQRLSLLQGQLDERQGKISELMMINDELQSKLTKVNSVMEVYTGKINEMQNKYEELYNNYELEKQKVNKSDGFNNSKCKKCEQLMKTIFRLNTHLNAKKS